jgi:putative Mg2+ transporter-C (MgtC) family protein
MNPDVLLPNRRHQIHRWRAMLKDEGPVHGTATVASLWATGVIGIAAGLAAYDVAVVICLFMIITLYVLSRLKSKDQGG